MHIAFVSLGAFGHINPTLALVTELVKKGVRVTYFTTEAFRTIIEPTGAKFVAVPSWMAENDKHNEDGEKKEDDGGVAAAVPFLFLNEAGAYIDTVLDTLKNDKPDAVVHDFAGIAGTIAADNLKVANVMLYTSYPSNDSYSVAAGFENCPPDHPLRKAAAQLAQTYAKKYGCRLLTVKEIFDGHGDFNLVMMQKKLVPNYETFDDSFVFTGVQIGKRDRPSAAGRPPTTANPCCTLPWAPPSTTGRSITLSCLTQSGTWTSTSSQPWVPSTPPA